MFNYNFTLRTFFARSCRKTWSLHPLVGRPGRLGSGGEGRGGGLGGGVRPGQSLRGCQARVRRVVRRSSVSWSGQTLACLPSLLLSSHRTDLSEDRRLEVPERRTERGMFIGRVEVTSGRLRLRRGGRRLELGSSHGSCSSVMVPVSVTVPGRGSSIETLEHLSPVQVIVRRPLFSVHSSSSTSVFIARLLLIAAKLSVSWRVTGEHVVSPV